MFLTHPPPAPASPLVGADGEPLPTAGGSVQREWSAWPLRPPSPAPGCHCHGQDSWRPGLWAFPAWGPKCYPSCMALPRMTHWKLMGVVGVGSPQGRAEAPAPFPCLLLTELPPDGLGFHTAPQSQEQNRTVVEVVGFLRLRHHGPCSSGPDRGVPRGPQRALPKPGGSCSSACEQAWCGLAALRGAMWRPDSSVGWRWVP